MSSTAAPARGGAQIPPCCDSAESARHAKILRQRHDTRAASSPLGRRASPALGHAVAAITSFVLAGTAQDDRPARPSPPPNAPDADRPGDAPPAEADGRTP